MSIELMKSRRSIRRFKSARPGREVIEQLIEAAVTAPSASNKQPWRFFIVTNESIQRRLVESIQAAVDRVAGHVEPRFEEAFRAYGDYFTRFENAPVLIVPLCRPMNLLTRMVDEKLAPSDRAAILNMEERSGVVSTSLAFQNILLRAHELGLGASGMTGPLIAGDDLREILSVPDSWEIVAFIPVGFPDEQPDPQPRKPIDAVVKWLE
jgi:nitroreductase